jgi:hypothetical protein
MNNNKAIGIVFLLFACASCTKNFKTYNSNPNSVDTSLLKNDNVGVGAYFPQMEQAVIFNATPGDASVYQVATNLNADLYSGYMGTATQGFQAQNGTYNFNQGWNNSCFTVEYTNLMPAWLSIKQLCETQYPHLYAMANIIKVAGMHRVTDVFGPIPYSQVGAGGFSVGFDAQQGIYNDFFAELDSSIATLTSYVQQFPGATPAAKFDMIYGGDFVRWIRFANSLKLRLAMHIRYADAALAQKEAESAISNSFGVMTVNTDNAALATSNGVTVTNPLWVIAGGYGDVRAGAVLGSFLTGYNDPRLSLYLTPSTLYPGTFIGVRNGINVVVNKDRIGYSSLAITQNQPIQWMNAAEVYFLRAEGTLLGWNMGVGTAQSFYETGIQTSFGQWGATGASGYIANNTSLPAPYVDPVAPSGVNDVAAGNPALSTVTIQWDPSAAFERNLERILTQKYIAMYPNGQEAWTEFRRTGYPKIWPVVVNNSNGTIPTALEVRRLPYPSSQTQSNPTGVNQGISELGGPDNGGTKLWWDKNPNH